MDGGFGSGAVDPTGSFSAGIPLELPPARDDIPVPLAVSYGAAGVGAAGVGWDVRLSYVRRTTSYARRRPMFTAWSPPTGREEVTVVLAGHAMSFGQVAPGEWRAKRDAPEYELIDVGDGWALTDLGGRVHLFPERSDLEGTGMWLLDSVRNADASSVVSLDYEVRSHTVDGVTGVSIDLTHLAYNRHPSAGCDKHAIWLDYGSDFDAPLATRFLEHELVVRTRLLTQIRVEARATCTSAPEELRRYELVYSDDPDTGLPRLGSARVRGRAGTAQVTLASYTYGTATRDGALVYTPGWPVTLPAGADSEEIASTASFQGIWVPVKSVGTGVTATWQSLADFTGDGRADLVFRDGTSDDLLLGVNRPGTDGALALGPSSSTVVPFTGAVLPAGPLEIRSSELPRWVGHDIDDANIDYLWRQAIDVNGDGRTDIVDAREAEDQWVFYLNTPGATPYDIVWVRQPISNAHVLQQLDLRDMDPLVDGYLPLSRRYTWRDHDWWSCQRWLPDDGWEIYPGPCPQSELFPDNYGPQVTYTDWLLTDANGDGYVDVAMNGSPAQAVYTSNRPAVPDPGVIRPVHSFRRIMPTLGIDNTVDVMLNSAGIRLSETASPFADALPFEVSACGVEQWTEGSIAHAESQVMRCGLADVNGDRVLDRVDGESAYLGRGIGFSNVRIDLPGPLSLQLVDHTRICRDPENPLPPPYDEPFSSWIEAGLRDLTGDGIPDYIRLGGPSWVVSVGTGTGFGTPIPIEVDGEDMGFEISDHEETCNGARSRTSSGLFDIDGDGKPEVVRQAGNGTFELLHLAGGGTSERAPDAGRLIEVRSGHGTATRVSYRSAKEDALTPHQIPMPELVVSAVETIGLYGLGGTLASTRYAYGDADTHYDAARDAFVPLPYGRTIALTTGANDSEAVGTLTITDSYGIDPFIHGAPPEENFGRYLRAGRTSDVTTLAGVFLADPWMYLAHDTTNDSRLTGVTHYDHEVRVLPEQVPVGTAHPLDCIDFLDPYDYLASLAPGLGAGYDLCSGHGFGYVAAVESWRGTQAPPATTHVATRSETLQVDDLGRTLRFADYNDRYRSDDDLCFEMTYASSSWDVRTALASRRVHDCSKPTTYARELYEYDGLPVGQAELGRLTARTVHVHDAVTGAFLREIREGDISYDDLGNPRLIVAERDDGAVRMTSFDYDAFGLVPISMVVESADTLPLETSYDHDPVTLELVWTHEPNGTAVGTERDGFGRPTRATVHTPEMVKPMVASTTEYVGFDNDDPAGRRIVVKSFVDPVLPTAVASTPGKVATTYLDELGRVRLAVAALGRSYGDEQMVTTNASYDVFGRVVFAADPYPATQDARTAYGTSYHFDHRGDPSCTIRGKGPQAFSMVVDEANERFPTCYQHTFANREEVLAVREASSFVPSAPEAGVVRYETLSAVGRLTRRETWKGNARLEVATFAHNPLGSVAQMTRYHDAANQALPVTWRAYHDSLGRRIRLEEPEALPRYFEFSDFGELTATRWLDVSTGLPVERVVSREYDPLGRVIHAMETHNGQPDEEAEHFYFYDTPEEVGSEVRPRNTLGRLSYAQSPTGQVFLSYDAYGRVEARIFDDHGSERHVEKTLRNLDGSLRTLSFHLPDNAMKEELATYDYDSAGRLASIKFRNGSESLVLFEATTTDAFGRLSKARYGGGKITFNALDAQTGRRLPQSMHVAAVGGTRDLYLLGFDPVGREKSRREVIDGANGGMGEKTNVAYDALGRIVSSQRTGPTYQVTNDTFGYDALGNATGLVDGIGTRDAAMSYRSVDRDRLCRIGYGNGGLGGSTCNVVHDGVGNVIEQPTRSGDIRRSEYLASGQVRRLTQGKATASLRYDAFGSLEEIDVTGTGIVEPRRDRRYGALIESSSLRVGSSLRTVITRRIPGAAGDVSQRRGARGPWLFTFGEARGTRFVVDQDGRFTQDQRYQPFGESIASGAQPLALTYLDGHWNGGNLLADFGVVLVGARVYDPVIGRFLSRDPLMVTRSAATTNPYAFALNDPQNLTDPTGLDVDCYGQECQGPPGGGGPEVPGGGPRPFNWDALPQYLPGQSQGGRNAPQPGRAHQPAPSLVPFAEPPQSTPLSRSTVIYDMTSEEKIIYLDALILGIGDDILKRNPIIPGRAESHARVVVARHRRAHRFDGMAPHELVAATLREKALNDQAAQNRILLLGDDLEWADGASRIGPLVEPGMPEVWAHADLNKLTRKFIGREVEITPGEVLSALSRLNHVPGQPWVLAGCFTGRGWYNRAQYYANLTGSVVWASPDAVQLHGVLNPWVSVPGGMVPFVPVWWRGPNGGK
jgi:RHS repeat-associated protein